MLENMKQELSDLMEVIEGMDQAAEDFASKVDQADALKNKIEQTEAAQSKLADLKSFKPKTAQAVEAPRVESVKEGFESDPKKGFQSAGEFLSVLAKDKFEQDHRMKHIKMTSGQHTTTNDGLMIPAELMPEINVIGKGLSDDILGQFDIKSTSRNSIELRRDAATTRGGSTGLVVGRIAEVAQMSSTRQVFEKSTVKLDKLYVYSEVSDEDLEDFPMLESNLTQTAPELLRIKMTEDIVFGNGVGRNLGFNQGGDFITVSARAAANDVQAADVANMLARHIRGPKSFWMVNHSVWAKLPLMTLGDQPVFQPDFRDGIQGRLLGLPVFTSEDCETLGTAGDIYLVNPDGYCALQKVGGAKSSTSMHVKFDYDIMAFKWTMRFGGIPLYDAPYTPRKGNTLSHFVNLSAST
jgi:HK97 family phage major capsid protein